LSAKPADLAVEQPKGLKFIVNLKAAKQIDLTIPPNVLARAEKVIRCNNFGFLILDFRLGDPRVRKLFVLCHALCSLRLAPPSRRSSRRKSSG
jgi:hypothetical protein